MVKCIHCESEVLPVKAHASAAALTVIVLAGGVFGLVVALMMGPLGLFFMFILPPLFIFALGVLYYLDIAVKQPVLCPKCGKNAYKRVKKWKGLLRGGWREE